MVLLLTCYTFVPIWLRFRGYFRIESLKFSLRGVHDMTTWSKKILALDNQIFETSFFSSCKAVFKAIYFLKATLVNTKTAQTPHCFDYCMQCQYAQRDILYVRISPGNLNHVLPRTNKGLRRKQPRNSYPLRKEKIIFPRSD